MAVPIFTGNVIAVMWDFDQTLIPGYQQQPLFDEYGIDSAAFWDEVNTLVEAYLARGDQVSRETMYLNRLLSYAEADLLPGLNNEKLRELGSRLQFYAGIPAFLEETKRLIEEDQEFQRQQITVEHYVISTGLRQIILGSAITPFVSGVWACEFLENPPDAGSKQIVEPSAARLRQVGYFLDSTTKTRAVWEINKGANVDPQIDVNSLISPEDRRVPIRNMIYVADGPSDIPIFSILNQYGGQTVGVYNPNDNQHYEQVRLLQEQGRVKMMAAADYRAGTEVHRWVTSTMRKIAELIVRDRQFAVMERVLPPARHVT